MLALGRRREDRLGNQRHSRHIGRGRTLPSRSLAPQAGREKPCASCGAARALGFVTSYRQARGSGPLQAAVMGEAVHPAARGHAFGQGFRTTSRAAATPGLLIGVLAIFDAGLVMRRATRGCRRRGCPAGHGQGRKGEEACSHHSSFHQSPTGERRDPLSARAKLGGSLDECQDRAPSPTFSTGAGCG
jgi:hypothetical protein